MEAVVRRDRDAFSLLLQRHAAGIHAFLFRHVHDAAEAEDLTQETFLRVWSRAGTWKPGRVRFTTWAYRIARNLAIDAWRGRAPEPDPEADVESVPEPSPAAMPGDEDRARRAVRAALSRLPERQRTALVLCHYRGFSNRDAAVTLEVSVEALESLLSRARRALRAALAEYREA